MFLLSVWFRVFQWRLYAYKYSSVFWSQNQKRFLKSWWRLDICPYLEFSSHPFSVFFFTFPLRDTWVKEVPQAALHVIFQVATSIYWRCFWNFHVKIQRVWMIVGGQGSQHGPLFATASCKQNLPLCKNDISIYTYLFSRYVFCYICCFEKEPKTWIIPYCFWGH